MKTYYVYILLCSDKTYYTGITNNLELRVKQHQIGYSIDSYTFSRRPIKLVFYEAFQDVYSAIDWEKRIKGWTRAKKKALIKGDFDQLKELAKCRNESNYENRG